MIDFARSPDGGANECACSGASDVYHGSDGVLPRRFLKEPTWPAMVGDEAVVATWKDIESAWEDLTTAFGQMVGAIRRSLGALWNAKETVACPGGEEVA
jgi:hypothetical protein